MPSTIAADGATEEGALIKTPFRFNLRHRFYPVRAKGANEIFRVQK
jgi:hypothetical protein